MKTIADAVSATGTHTLGVEAPQADKTGMVFIEISGTATVDVNLRIASGGTDFLVEAGITSSKAIPIALAPYVSIEVTSYTSGTVTVSLQD